MPFERRSSSAEHEANMSHRHEHMVNMPTVPMNISSDMNLSVNISAVWGSTI